MTSLQKLDDLNSKSNITLDEMIENLVALNSKNNITFDEMIKDLKNFNENFRRDTIMDEQIHKSLLDEIIKSQPFETA
jgi:hypothetical protein